MQYHSKTQRPIVSLVAISSSLCSLIFRSLPLGIKTYSSVLPSIHPIRPTRHHNIASEKPREIFSLLHWSPTLNPRPYINLHKIICLLICFTHRIDAGITVFTMRPYGSCQIPSRAGKNVRNPFRGRSINVRIPFCFSHSNSRIKKKKI